MTLPNLHTLSPKGSRLYASAADIEAELQALDDHAADELSNPSLHAPQTVTNDTGEHVLEGTSAEGGSSATLTKDEIIDRLRKQLEDARRKIAHLEYEEAKRVERTRKKVAEVLFPNPDMDWVYRKGNRYGVERLRSLIYREACAIGEGIFYHCKQLQDYALALSLCRGKRVERLHLNEVCAIREAVAALYNLTSLFKLHYIDDYNPDVAGQEAGHADAAINHD
jgi:hypothetical protein